jgi:RNA polymerase sigma-70 factor (ECF subfamily)
MKFREIAEFLKMPLGTVLWHYNKAIKHLKKEVGR